MFKEDPLRGHLLVFTNRKKNRVRVLEKLKEKRIAVIAQAVTQGLNPAAPMRDSGIPWLGQVPQHWKVKRLWFACTHIEQECADRDPAYHRARSDLRLHTETNG